MVSLYNTLRSYPWSPQTGWVLVASKPQMRWLALLIRMPIFGGFLGASHLEKSPGQSHNLIKVLCIRSGLGMPSESPVLLDREMSGFLNLASPGVNSHSKQLPTPRSLAFQIQTKIITFSGHLPPEILNWYLALNHLPWVAKASRMTRELHDVLEWFLMFSFNFRVTLVVLYCINMTIEKVFLVGVMNTMCLLSDGCNFFEPIYIVIYSWVLVFPDTNTDFIFLYSSAITDQYLSLEVQQTSVFFLSFL